MAYLASATQWLNEYGPVAWGGVGILSALGAALMMLAFAIAREHFARTNYVREMTKPPENINPLESNFEKKRFRVHEFFSHFFLINETKFFKECDIIGPGSIALLSHCHIISPRFLLCDFVPVNPGKNKSFSAAAFASSTFDHCRFFNVTIIIPEDELAMIRAATTAGSDEMNVLGTIPR